MSQEDSLSSTGSSPDIAMDAKISLTDEFRNDMLRLFTQPILSDLTLVVGEKKNIVRFKVHKAILAARCQYFFSLFHSTMQDSNATELTFPQHNPADWKVLVDFIYTAKVNINNENAFGVLKLSDELDITSIKEKCIEYVKDLVTDDNVLDVFEESRYHSFKELHAFCRGYIEENARRVFFSDNFLLLAKDSLKELLHSDKIQLPELEIFVAVVQWGKYQVQHIADNKGATPKIVFGKKSSRVKRSAPSRTVFKPTEAVAPTVEEVEQVTIEDVEPVIMQALNRVSLSESPPSPSPNRARSKSESNGHASHFEEELSVSELSHIENDADEDEEEDVQPKRSFSRVQLSPFTASMESGIDFTGPGHMLTGSSTTSHPSSFTSEQDIERFREQLDDLFDYVSDKPFVRQLAQYLSDIMPMIRFGILNPNEVYDYVEPSLIVSNDLLLEAYRSHALSDRIEVQDSTRLKVREGSLFYTAGVLESLPIKLLRGWTCIYHKPYADKTTEQVFRTALNGSATRILVAARHKNSNTLALAAMGRINVVLKETSDSSPCNLENGVYWYHWKNHSFGFSDTRNINLGTADLLDGKQKLSWHLTGRGGYRVGDIKNLNESKEWEKLVFVA